MTLLLEEEIDQACLKETKLKENDGYPVPTNAP